MVKYYKYYGGVGMKRNKSTLVLALALLAPIFIGGMANTTTTFADTSAVTQAATTQDQWTDTVVNKTIHTKNQSGLPIYDANGKAIQYETITGNVDFATTVEHKNNKTGDIYYQIGDGQYLSSSELTSGRPELKTYDVSATVHTLSAFKTVPLYDGDGNAVNNESVSGDTNWYTNRQINNNDTGVSYYQIATNRYVSSEYIDTYTPVNK